jgi:4-oxalocrotonate tautomerase
MIKDIKHVFISDKKGDETMPFVHVELVEGRSPEQLENMMKDITEAVHKNTQAPKEHIHVIINEMKKGTYGVNGEWKK